MSLDNEKNKEYQEQENLENQEDLPEQEDLDEQQTSDEKQEDQDDQEDQEDNHTKQIQELNKKIDDYDDQLKRSQAEFINFKKRSVQDKEKFAFYEIAKILNEFLAFKETLQKAISVEQNEESKEHLKQLESNYETILNRLQVKKIDLLGEDFDYNLAECVQTLKVKDKKQDNKILDVLENAYTYKEKLIKPAKVIVGELEE